MEMPDETHANTPDDSVSNDAPDAAPGGDAGESSPKQSAAEALAAEALAAAEQAVAGISTESEGGAARQAIAAAQQAVAGMSSEGATNVSIPTFESAKAGKAAPGGIDLLSDVNLSVKIELGRTRMYLEDVLRLSNGSVVELDKLAGDPVDVYVNDRHVARGEVLILNDNFCVRINEIIAGAGVGAAKAG